MADVKKIKTALISVYHKDGLDEFRKWKTSPPIRQSWADA